MADSVCLASGGLDSTVCLALLKNSGYSPLPLFVNYGQINCTVEFSALEESCDSLKLPYPEVLNLNGYGALIKSGLTQSNLHIVQDAFTPCRNLLFIVGAAAVANSRGIDKVVLGLLHESTILFPDQSDKFIESARRAISDALAVEMEILLPLRDFRKSDVVKLANELGVTGYSCHAGTTPPCGVCIACREYEGG